MLGEEEPVAEDNHSSFTPTATAGQPAGNSSRHRRIHKEVGAITGISFVNGSMLQMATASL